MTAFDEGEIVFRSNYLTLEVERKYNFKEEFFWQRQESWGMHLFDFQVMIFGLFVAP